MDGNKTGKALGIGTFNLGGIEQDTKLEMGDVRNYIKKIKSIALQLDYWKKQEGIKGLTEQDKAADVLLDYKQTIVEEALVRAGMDAHEAKELCSFNYADIVRDGAIETWLGFITKDEDDEQSKIKN